MKTFEGVAIAIELPARVTLEIAETEPVVKGQTASSSFKTATPVERRQDHGPAPYRRRHPRRRDDRRRLLRRARQGLSVFAAPE